MKNYILIMIGLVSTIVCKAQIKSSLLFENKYQIDGVVFSKEYVPNYIKLPTGIERFTPNSDNIKRAEKYLLLNQTDVSYSGFTVSYLPKSLKQTLKPFKRQYLGWLDNNRDTVILVQLLNFKYKRNARAFDDWEKDFVVGNGDFYYENMVSFLINLSRKSVSFF